MKFCRLNLYLRFKKKKKDVMSQEFYYKQSTFFFKFEIKLNAYKIRNLIRNLRNRKINKIKNIYIDSNLMVRIILMCLLLYFEMTLFAKNL